MKSIVQFLKEAHSRVTLAWMEEHYEKYNKELFDNELPRKIELGYIKGRSDSLGEQGYNKGWYYQKDDLKNDMYRMFVYESKHYGPGEEKTEKRNGFTVVVRQEQVKKYINNCVELDPFINMSLKYNFSDFQKEDTLIHEMIHLWVSKDGLSPKRSHGKEFKRKCNEIRAKAKRLYGVEYDLQTTAVNTDDESKSFEYTEEIKNSIKNDLIKASKRGGGIYSIYLEFDKSKMPSSTPFERKMQGFTKRFFFCTKNNAANIFRQIETSPEAKSITHIWVNDTSYVPMSEKYGKFRTMRVYDRFWNVEDYDERILKRGAIDLLNGKVNEGLLSGIKKIINKIMGLFIKVPAGIPMDNFNPGDLADSIDELEDYSVELEGSAQNNKKAIMLE